MPLNLSFPSQYFHDISTVKKEIENFSIQPEETQPNKLKYINK